jgi:hypothetical protein
MCSTHDMTSTSVRPQPKPPGPEGASPGILGAAWSKIDGSDVLGCVLLMGMSTSGFTTNFWALAATPACIYAGLLLGELTRRRRAWKHAHPYVG